MAQRHKPRKDRIWIQNLGRPCGSHVSPHVRGPGLQQGEQGTTDHYQSRPKDPHDTASTRVVPKQPSQSLVQQVFSPVLYYSRTGKRAEAVCNCGTAFFLKLGGNSSVGQPDPLAVGTRHFGQYLAHLTTLTIIDHQRAASNKFSRLLHAKNHRLLLSFRMSTTLKVMLLSF